MAWQRLCRFFKFVWFHFCFTQKQMLCLEGLRSETDTDVNVFSAKLRTRSNVNVLIFLRNKRWLVSKEQLCDLTGCRGVIFCTTNSASDVMLSSELYFPNLSDMKLSKVSASFLSRSVMPMKFPACSMALRMISSRCSEANKCWESRKWGNKKMNGRLILQYTEEKYARKHFRGNVPVCWSPRIRCKSRPGNQRPPRNPPRSDSRRNTPLGWCAGQSGRCRLGSPQDTQASSSRSSGACSSCNAVSCTRKGISVEKIHLRTKTLLLFMTGVWTYPARYLSFGKLCSKSLQQQDKTCIWAAVQLHYCMKPN